MVQGSDLLTGNVVTKRSVSGKSIRARLNSDQEVQPHVSSGAIPQKIPTGEDYGAGVGRAISGLGNVFGNVLAKIGAQEEKNKFANARLDFENADREIRDNIRKNPDLVDGAPRLYDQTKSSIIKKYGFEKDPDKQLYFTQRANTRVHHYADIKQKRAVEGFIANENSSIDKAVNAIVADPTPETRDRVLSSLDELVENSVGSYRTRAQALERKQELKDHLSLKYIEKLKETDPDKAEAELKAFKEGRVQTNVDDQKTIDDKKPTNEKPIDGKQPKKINSQVPWDGKDIKGGIIEAANELGIDPVDLATAISYETAGTFNPAKRGPKTQWGRHKGLIQFGEPQAKKYGVDWKDPLGSQLGANGAVVKYLRAAGVKKGMGLLDIYSAINAGSVGRYNASDENNGGAPGTVRDKVNKQMSGHKAKAQKLLGDYKSQVAGSLQRAPVQTKRSKFVDKEITRLEKSIGKAQEEKREQEFIGGVVSGEIKVSGNDTETAKILNKAFNKQFQADTDFAGDAQARDSVLQMASNGVPLAKRLMQRLEGDLDSDVFEVRLKAIDLVDKLEKADPSQFKAAAGSEKLSKQLAQYRYLAEYKGSKGAMQHIMTASEAMNKMSAEGMKAAKNKALKDLDSEEFLTDMFDDNIDFWPGGLLTGTKDQDPVLGLTPKARAQIISEFEALFLSEFDATADADLAKASALNMIKSRYGVSNVSGTRAVMKYPPESFADPDDAEYIKEEFQKDAKEAIAHYSPILAQRGVQVIGEPTPVSDEYTRKTVIAWKAGKETLEAVPAEKDSEMLMDGISSAQELEMVKTRVTPSWRIAVKVSVNGVEGYHLLPENYNFTIEGLGARRAQRFNAIAKEANEAKELATQKELDKNKKAVQSKLNRVEGELSNSIMIDQLTGSNSAVGSELVKDGT